ncbi:hypothetical protein [Ralstonia solanacearum]|uniref:hypothetical protein n=1 Tax=Ralstonia solanacearum TaxID=305 RepID=UPI0018D00398|nr:hypothetical protein [Ralstonia solanacearum]
MTACLFFLSIYAISVFCSMFGLFRLSHGLRDWIDRAGNLANSSLLELAATSDREGLEAFSRYLLGASFIALAIGIFVGKFADERSGYILPISSMIFLYSAASIKAWSNRRNDVLLDYINKTKRDTQRYSIYYLAFSAVILTAMGAFGTWSRQLNLESFLSFAAFIFMGWAILIGSLLIANSISIGFIFAPALVAISYLWLSILIARGALAIGKQHLFNLLIAYNIIGTVYLALLGLPSLRIWLGIPAICQ